MAAIIGALRADLSASVGKFAADMGKAAKEVEQFGKRAGRVGRDLSNAGRSLTVGLTAPILAAGVGAIKVSMDFEKAMNEVSISTQATAAEMGKLEEAARAIGKSTVFSATEAAQAIDMLAKNGLGVADILGGAAAAATSLAAATGSELEPAAAAVTDAMQQFDIAAKDLPATINQITGAVNESKLSFEDFALASGQAGGVAGALGVSFTDFNAVLAATSPLFSSGSDAGTSFKTFLQRLVPTTTAAATAIADANLQFFNADGSMRSMSEIAESLRMGLSGLSDEAKNEALKDIFGTDAMRTAIGLMDQGAAGLDKVKESIAATDAAAQAAKRMEGLTGQLEQLKGAAEELGIAVGNSGLLDFITDLVKGAADLLDKVSALNPEILMWVVVLGGVLAVVGPVLLFVGSLATGLSSIIALLPIITPLVVGLWTAMLGPIGLIVAAVVGLGVVWAVFGDDIVRIMKMAGDAMAGLYSKAKAWLVDKLGGIMALAGRKVREFIEPFRLLYKEVVGNSYIPDLVEDVGDWMDKLPKVMGDPTDEAVQRVSKAFLDLGKDISDSLASIDLPAATEAANRYRESLAGVAEQAKEAGVSTANIAQAVGVLNEQINLFEQAGLSEEAADFARKTEQSARVVRDFARGGLAPLAARLEEVDDRYEAVRTRIEDAINENRVLAETNDAAAATMVNLAQQLTDLAGAHAQATDAAKAQYAAEEAISNLQAQRQGMGIAEDIAASERSVSTSFESQGAGELRRIEADLQQTRIDALIRLREMEAAKDEAALVGDQEEVTRLSGIIDLQRTLYDQVTETTGIQIQAAARIRDAYSDFADGLSSELTGMVMEWKVDMDGLRSVFSDLAKQLFIKPATDSFSAGISSFLSSFAGGFATGGTIPAGGWGIVGENGPEPILAGRRAATVYPNEMMGAGGGGTVVFNVKTPDANSFRASQRQMARQAKQALGGV